MSTVAEASRAARPRTTADRPGYTPQDDGSSIFDGHNSSSPLAAMRPVGALKSSDSVMMSSNTDNYKDDDDDNDGEYKGEYEDYDNGAYDDGPSLPPQQVVHDRTSITSMNTVDFMMTLLSNDDVDEDEDEDTQWQT
jgi:hypothetical protein